MISHHDASIRYETLADTLIHAKSFVDNELKHGQVSCSSDKSNLQTLSFQIEQVIQKAQAYSMTYASKRS